MKIQLIILALFVVATLAHRQRDGDDENQVRRRGRWNRRNRDSQVYADAEEAAEMEDAVPTEGEVVIVDIIKALSINMKEAIVTWAKVRLVHSSATILTGTSSTACQCPMETLRSVDGIIIIIIDALIIIIIIQQLYQQLLLRQRPRQPASMITSKSTSVNNRFLVNILYSNYSIDVRSHNDIDSAENVNHDP